MGGNLSFNLVPDETDCVLEKPLGFAQDQAKAVSAHPLFYFTKEPIQGS